MRLQAAVVLGLFRGEPLLSSFANRVGTATQDLGKNNVYSPIVREDILIIVLLLGFVGLSRPLGVGARWSDLATPELCPAGFWHYPADF